MKPSDRMLKLPASGTLSVGQNIRALRAAGQDIINLAGGQPDPPPPVSAIARQAARIEIMIARPLLAPSTWPCSDMSKFPAIPNRGHSAKPRNHKAIPVVGSCAGHSSPHIGRRMPG